MDKKTVLSLDSKTIDSLLKDVKNDIDNAKRTGQPFTIKHIETLEAIEKYLEGTQSRVWMSQHPEFK